MYERKRIQASADLVIRNETSAQVNVLKECGFCYATFRTNHGALALGDDPHKNCSCAKSFLTIHFRAKCSNCLLLNLLCTSSEILDLMQFAHHTTSFPIASPTHRLQHQSSRSIAVTNSFRGPAARMMIFLVTLNIAVWIWAFLLFHPYPVLLN